MALSDVDVLLAAQAGGESNDPVWQEFFGRFQRLLRYLANHACQHYGLHSSEADEILQVALIALASPNTTRFDPSRGNGGIEPYLRGLVQNAARGQKRFVRKGAELRHDWSHPDNLRYHRPVSLNDLRDPFDHPALIEAHEEALAAAVMADEGERDLLNRIFVQNEAVADVADALGIDRSTVSRRLSRFYIRVRLQRLQFWMLDSCYRN